MKAFFTREKIFFGLIILLAIVVRFFKLGEVPIELTRDEASLGYTAYSLLKTGHEEHGTAWPIQIESFGDWKLPLYVYTLIPFIQVFGLTMWSVRLLSALAGVSVVVSSYFLVRLLIPDKKNRQPLPLLVPLLLAVSPWAVHFSHGAYEANLTLALFLWGLIGVLTVLRDFTARQARRIGLLIVSLSAWALTPLGYHSYQVFLPLFLLVITWLYWPVWKKFFAGEKVKLAGAVTPLLLVGFMMLFSGAHGADATKFKALSIFNLSAYTKTVNEVRTAFIQLDNPWFALTANKLEAFSNQIITNFFRLISPEFLFLQGGVNHSHNITGFGNLYPLIFFGLVIGLCLIVIERRPWQLLLGGWLLSAGVAPMITFEANHTTRFSPGLIVLEILSVYGWLKIMQAAQKYLPKKGAVLLLLALAIGLTYSAYHFLVHYYFAFPARDAQYWLWQIKPLVAFVDNVKDQYDAVYWQDERYSPYIYFLIYEPADPATLQNRIEYYPVDVEGFHHVKRLDNIYFQTIDWQNEALYAGKKVLFVIEEQQIPDYNRSQETTKLLMTVKHDLVPKGVDIWEYQGKPAEK